MQETKKQMWYDKAIVWLLYSLGIGVPLVFSTSFYSNFAEPKLLFLRVVTLLVLLLWAWKSYLEEKITFRKGKFALVLLAYGAALVVSTLTSASVYSSLLGTETRFLGIFTQLNFLLVAWLVYNFLPKKKQLKTFITIMFITGVVGLMIYGFFQYFGIFQDNASWSQNPQERVFGTFGHSNHFGAYMGMCIMLGFGVIPFLKNKILQRLLIFCVHAAFIVVLLTGSRAALVATVLSLATVMVILTIRSKNLRMFLKKFWWTFAAGLVIIGGIIFVFRTQLSALPVVQRLQQGTESAEQGYPPDRLSWWMSSVQMFKEKPLFGFGVSTFRDIYNKYRRYDYMVPGPGDIQYQITPESSHNDYIDILVGSGLLGLVTFLGLIIFVFLGVDKKLLEKQKPDQLFFITLGIKGALMVYLIQVIVNFGVVDTLTVFFLLLGAAASATSMSQQWLEIRLKPLVKEAALLMFFVVLLWGGFATTREALAEHYYKNAIIEESLGRVENARTWYEETIRQQPNRYEYYEAFADFAFKTGTESEVDPEYTRQYLQIALQNYQSASVINNYHPSTFYNMGITSIQLAHLERSDAYRVQGVNALQQAIALSPNNPLYAYESSKVFAEIGEKDLAVKNLTEVVRVNPMYMDAQKRLDELQKSL